jgi:hypothetical protein
VSLRSMLAASESVAYSPRTLELNLPFPFLRTGALFFRLVFYISRQHCLESALNDSKLNAKTYSPIVVVTLLRIDRSVGCSSGDDPTYYGKSTIEL